MRKLSLTLLAASIALIAGHRFGAAGPRGGRAPAPPGAAAA